MYIRLLGLIYKKLIKRKIMAKQVTTLQPTITAYAKTLLIRN